MRLLIYGSKEFAHTVADLVRHCGHELVGMVDDFNSGPQILGTFDTVVHAFPPSEYGFAIAVGYADIPGRWAVWQKIFAKGYRAPALIHPRAYVADTAQVGEGCMVMAAAIVDVRAKLDELAVVWPGSCINHDVVVGSNTFVSPGVTICGASRIGSNTFIGAGTVIADHCEIPAGSFIKMMTRYSNVQL